MWSGNSPAYHGGIDPGLATYIGLAFDKRAAALSSRDQGRCTRRHQLVCIAICEHQAYQANDKLGQAKQVSATWKRIMPP